MAGTAFKDAGVLAALDGIVPVYVDADVDEDAPRAWGVRALPTTIFLDASGEEVDRVVGAPPANDFAARVEKVKSRL